MEWDSRMGPYSTSSHLSNIRKRIYSEKITAKLQSGSQTHDTFIKADFLFASAVVSIRIGSGVKSEGSLVVSGTKGYAYVPAPWWKTDFFEIRYEDLACNKRYFYQLDGEGIRYELVAFIKSIHTGKNLSQIDCQTTRSIVSFMQDYAEGIDLYKIW